MDDKEVIIKYSSYTPSQKKATQKYRELNKDKINEQRKEYYKQRKDSDPDFLEYKRNKAKIPETVPEPEPVKVEVVIPEPVKEKKPRKKSVKKEPEPIIEPVKEEIKEEIKESPIIDETIKEKKERKKRAPKVVKSDS